MDKQKTIDVPMPEWADGLIRRALAEHINNCPVAPRVQRMEIKFAALVGYMVGSGFIGGMAGAAIVGKLMGGA